jgi:hypothetical protein
VLLLSEQFLLLLLKQYQTLLLLEQGRIPLKLELRLRLVFLKKEPFL